MTVSVGGNPMTVLSPSPAPTETPSPSPAANVSVVLQAKTESVEGRPLSDFIYPGAGVSSQSSSEIVMASSSSPSVVTDYYKSKITALKPSSKAFVVTNTNGTVDNKLAFSENGHQITVEIKNNSASGSLIIVSQN